MKSAGSHFLLKKTKTHVNSRIVVVFFFIEIFDLSSEIDSSYALTIHWGDFLILYMPELQFKFFIIWISYPFIRWL